MRAGPIGAIIEKILRSDSSPGIFIPDKLPFIQWKSSRTIATADSTTSANIPFNPLHQAAAFRGCTISIRASIFTTYEIIRNKSTNACSEATSTRWIKESSLSSRLHVPTMRDEIQSLPAGPTFKEPTTFGYPSLQALVSIREFSMIYITYRKRFHNFLCSEKIQCIHSTTLLFFPQCFLAEIRLN